MSRWWDVCRYGVVVDAASAMGAGVRDVKRNDDFEPDDEPYDVGSPVKVPKETATAPPVPSAHGPGRFPNFAESFLGSRVGMASTPQSLKDQGITVTHDSPEREYRGRFDVAGQPFEVNVEPVDLPGSYMLTFRHATASEGGYNLTNLFRERPQAASRVFRNVGALVLEVMRQRHPSKLAFSADRSETSRVRLYDFLTEKMSQKTGYQLKRYEGKHAVFYRLIRPKGMKEVPPVRWGGRTYRSWWSVCRYADDAQGDVSPIEGEAGGRVSVAGGASASPAVSPARPPVRGRGRTTMLRPPAQEEVSFATSGNVPESERGQAEDFFTGADPHHPHVSRALQDVLDLTVAERAPLPSREISPHEHARDERYARWLRLLHHGGYPPVDENGLWQIPPERRELLANFTRAAARDPDLEQNTLALLGSLEREKAHRRPYDPGLPTSQLAERAMQQALDERKGDDSGSGDDRRNWYVSQVGRNFRAAVDRDDRLRHLVGDIYDRGGRIENLRHARDLTRWSEERQIYPHLLDHSGEYLAAEATAKRPDFMGAVAKLLGAHEYEKDKIRTFSVTGFDKIRRAGRERGLRLLQLTPQQLKFLEQPDDSPLTFFRDVKIPGVLVVADLRHYPPVATRRTPSGEPIFDRANVQLEDLKSRDRSDALGVSQVKRAGKNRNGLWEIDIDFRDEDDSDSRMAKKSYREGLESLGRDTTSDGDVTSPRAVRGEPGRGAPKESNRYYRLGRYEVRHYAQPQEWGEAGTRDDSAAGQERRRGVWKNAYRDLRWGLFRGSDLVARKGLWEAIRERLRERGHSHANDMRALRPDDESTRRSDDEEKPPWRSDDEKDRHPFAQSLVGLSQDEEEPPWRSGDEEEPPWRERKEDKTRPREIDNPIEEMLLDDVYERWREREQQRHEQSRGRAIPGPGPSASRELDRIVQDVVDRWFPRDAETFDALHDFSRAKGDPYKIDWDNLIVADSMHRRALVRHFPLDDFPEVLYPLVKRTMDFGLPSDIWGGHGRSGPILEVLEEIRQRDRDPRASETASQGSRVELSALRNPGEARGMMELQKWAHRHHLVDHLSDGDDLGRLSDALRPAIVEMARRPRLVGKIMSGSGGSLSVGMLADQLVKHDLSLKAARSTVNEMIRVGLLRAANPTERVPGRKRDDVRVRLTTAKDFESR